MIDRRSFLGGGLVTLTAAMLTPAAAQASTFKIGVSAAMSGDAAGYGKPYPDAILVTAEELNKAGGTGGRSCRGCRRAQLSRRSSGRTTRSHRNP